MTNLSYLSDGWLELESDPGLFTLLIQDFGCKNVQVEEIYDLSKVGLIEDHVYGFIFLFKWTEERRSRQRQMFISNNTQQIMNNNKSKSNDSSQQEPYYVEDENFVNSIFFAHQIIPNSCATHAILSVLLNCNQINLGCYLDRLKEMTQSMDPESKGLAIGNIPELAKAHNSHASEIDTQEKRNKQTQSKTNSFPRTSPSTGDSFHFISFVNINNKVYELDGLKKFPVDHGFIGENETFSEKFRKIILERIPQQQQKENKMNLQLRKLQTDMNTTLNEDIRYSLMAVIPDRCKENSRRLKLLKAKRSMLMDTLANLIKPPKLPEPYETHNYSKYSATIDLKSDVEPDLHKFTVKDVNFSKEVNQKDHLNNKSANNLTKETIDQSNSNEQDNEDDNSTDTCSECESKFSDYDESCDEDSKINSFYAFKFVPLKEQNNESNLLSKTTITDKKIVNEEDANNGSNSFVSNNENNNQTNKSINLNNFKTFTKAELIDFYRDYGLKDLLKILNKVEQEISICEQNIKEETEKRTKFYVDDGRRTHNYNEFITTYLLMLTEQKKLNEFIETKDRPDVNLMNASTNQDSMDSENAPINFFKEILTNYEDVLMDDEEQMITTDIEQQQNESLSNEMISTSSKISNGRSNGTSSKNRSNVIASKCATSKSTNNTTINSSPEEDLSKSKRRTSRTLVTKRKDK